MFLSFSKETFSKELVLLYVEQTMSPPCSPFLLPHPLLSSLQYNNSNYVQTTKHASSNDRTDMGKLAHLHNNKCRFEPIESLLTFKWYKDVISKVCAYPGWLSVWMCIEWSNSHVSAYALHSSVQHWQPCWQCFVIGEKMEVEKVGRGHWRAHRSALYDWGRGVKCGVMSMMDVDFWHQKVEGEAHAFSLLFLLQSWRWKDKRHKQPFQYRNLGQKKC